VGGEVRNPGVYPLEGAPTALQAVITAQGLHRQLAPLNDVIVVRRNPERQAARLQRPTCASRLSAATPTTT
jgi:protein involved in polysaccharide export with SLBB domain